MKNGQSLLIAICFSALFACTPSSRNSDYGNADSVTQNDEQVSDTEQVRATANITSASGSNVNGRAHFNQVGDMTVRMEIQVSGLTPGGNHALHIHETGDCSAPDATSAGGHWNPTGEPHGKRGEGQFHKGDIINLQADSDGNATFTADIEGWTVGGADSTNIVGHAVIIHANADDFTSQPSGAAGERIACGVIFGAASGL